MTIELAAKSGPFQDRPWLDVAVTLLLGGILTLIAESVGLFPHGTAWIALPAVIPVGILFAWRRHRTAPSTRRVTITADQAAQIKAMIADGTDDEAVKRCICLLQSAGFDKKQAELAVLHFFHQANPARLKLMAPYFETREIHEESADD